MTAHAKRAGRDLTGLRLDGQYQLVRRIAEGSMGTVYEARRVGENHPLAVKVLRKREDDSDDTLSRFRREAEATLALAHPNVVTVHSFGETSQGIHYLVMELLEGRSLEAVLRQQPLAQEPAVDVAEQVAAGLEAAHTLGLVHRDLKPANVWLSPGPQGKSVAKIIDFGLVKPTNLDGPSYQTGPGMMVGTAYYMSPEQIDGTQLDARSDVYALGVLTFEMMTGHPPFVGRTPYDVMAQHVRQPAPPLRESCPYRVSSLLNDLVSACLQKAPKDRPQTATEVRVVLATVLLDLASGDD